MASGVKSPCKRRWSAVATACSRSASSVANKNEVVRCDVARCVAVRKDHRGRSQSATGEKWRCWRVDTPSLSCALSTVLRGRPLSPSLSPSLPQSLSPSLRRLFFCFRFSKVTYTSDTRGFLRAFDKGVIRGVPAGNYMSTTMFCGRPLSSRPAPSRHRRHGCRLTS